MKNKNQESVLSAMDRLFMSIKLKGKRKGMPRVNHRKMVKLWLDQKIKNNGKPVLVQYICSDVDGAFLSKEERKILKIQQNREGKVAEVNPMLAKVLIMNGQARLIEKNLSNIN